MNERIEKIQRKVKRYLDENRYNHTLGVMYTAGSLAMCHGANIEKAMIGGLLHDCAKCIPSDKKIKICKKNNIPMKEVEMANPGLLHAKIGAFFAETKYHISDYEILDAIRSHTTGQPDMTDIQKIVYIADFIEPNRRPLPNMPIVRKLAFEDLDKCIYRLLEDSLSYLKSRKIPIDPQTEETYNFYKNKMELK